MTHPILPEERALIDMFEHPKQKDHLLTSVARQIEDAESVVYVVGKVLESHEGGSESHALLCAGDKLFKLRCDISALSAYQERQRETEEQAPSPATTTPSPANDDDCESPSVQLNNVLIDIVQQYHRVHAQELNDGIADLITDALRLSAQIPAHYVGVVTDAEVSHG